MAKHKNIVITILALTISAVVSILVGPISSAQSSPTTDLNWNSQGNVTGTIFLGTQHHNITFTGTPPEPMTSSSVSFSVPGSGIAPVQCNITINLTVTGESSGNLSAAGNAPSACNERVSGTTSIGGNAPDDLAPARDDSEDSDPSTCKIDGTGWMICGIALTMAKAMDGLYSLMEGLLIVPNLNVNISDDTNGMYRAWQIVRNIANLAFVVAFLIIIFSHVTSVGLSNYNVKKMLPRLVIAAILVNISYWISAIAVDASNLLGNSIYEMLQNIRMNLGNISLGNGWEILISGLLAGAAVVIAGGAIVSEALEVAAAGDSVMSAAFWVAFPALLGAVLAVLVAITIIAIRHALVVVLIIISPLAFVAFLLPNTEKLFHTWRKLLTAMLVFYPLVSLIFAGAQLTSILILQSLEDVDGFVMHMIGLALFIQVAPLVLLPKIITLGSGMIGRITGVVSNKNRGLIDKAKGVRRRKNERMMGDFRNRDPKRFRRGPLKGRRTSTGLLQSGARRIDHGRRDDEAAIKSNESVSQSKWLDSEVGRRSTLRSAKAEEELKRATSESAAAAERGVPIDLKLKARSADIDKQSAEAKTTQAFEEFIAGANREASGAFSSMSDDEFNAMQEQALAAKSSLDTATSATGIAKGEQVENRSKEILRDAELAKAAGGISSMGMERAQASAIAALNQKEDEELRAASAIMSEANLSMYDYLKLTRGLGDVERTVGEGEDARTFKFSSSDMITKLAATDKVTSMASTSDIEDLVEESGSWSDTQRKILVQGMQSNGHIKKAPQWSSINQDHIGQGKVINRIADIKNDPAAIAEYKQELADKFDLDMSNDADRAVVDNHVSKQIAAAEKQLASQQAGEERFTSRDLAVNTIERGKVGAAQLATAHKSSLKLMLDVMPELSEDRRAGLMKSIEEAVANDNLRQSIKPEAKVVLDQIYGQDIFTINKQSSSRGGAAATAASGSSASSGQPQSSTTTSASTQQSSSAAGGQSGTATASTSQTSGQTPAGGILKVQHENTPGGGAPQSVQYVTNQDIRSSYNISNQTSNYMPADQRMRTSPPQGTSNYQQAESGLYTPPPPTQQRRAAQRLAVSPGSPAAANPQVHPEDFNTGIRQQVQDEMYRANPWLDKDES